MRRIGVTLILILAAVSILGACTKPAGSRLAFTSDRDGNREIYVMDADGSNQTRLTNNPGYEGGAVWLP